MIDDADVEFGRSVPELYERFLVPLVFESYAADLVARLVRIGTRSVLDVACETGVVTRELAARLDMDDLPVRGHGLPRSTGWVR